METRKSPNPAGKAGTAIPATQRTPPLIAPQEAPEVIPAAREPQPAANIAGQVTAAVLRDVKPIHRLEITEEEEEVLSEPIPEEAIQILPHGLIYLPWSFYADRLNRAFGRTKWQLLAISDVRIRSSPAANGSLTITREYALIIKGCLVGTAFGEQDFFPRSQQMTEIEAIEATQSNAIRRLVGKRLGVGLALWDRDYVEAWLSRYAVQDVQNKRTGKTEWRKKTPQEIAEDQAKSKTEETRSDGETAADREAKDGTTDR